MKMCAGVLEGVECVPGLHRVSGCCVGGVGILCWKGVSGKSQGNVGRQRVRMDAALECVSGEQRTSEPQEAGK